MTELIQALLDANEAMQKASARVQETKKAVEEASDIQPGDLVLIVAKPVLHRSIGSANGPSLGNEAIGLTTTVRYVNVNMLGEISYTTDWRDSAGLLWCWDRAELELVEKE